MIEESGRGAMRLATYRSQEDRVRTKEGFEGGNYLRVFDGKSMLSRVRQCDNFITRFHINHSNFELPPSKGISVEESLNYIKSG